MSTTLARRVRRIGLLPTTYRESVEERLTYNEDGTESAKRVVVKTPERHRAKLSLEELARLRGQIVVAHREKRKLRRQKEREMLRFEKQQKNDRIAKAMAKLIHK